MREIKFRAWGKKYKEMMFQEINQDEVFGYNIEYYPKNSARFVRLECALASDKYILLQFTGLKDKNGKEIYEGNIVKGIVSDSERNEPFKKMIIKYEDDSFALYRPEKKFNVNSGLYFGDLSSCILNKSIKVIGNIYENPELMK